VPPEQSPPEFTWPDGARRGAARHSVRRSSLYLVLKGRLTVSASCPSRAVDHSVPRLLEGVRRAEATILENNIVQTTGSAGESIAFGRASPCRRSAARSRWTHRVMTVAVLGGILAPHETRSAGRSS